MKSIFLVGLLVLVGSICMANGQLLDNVLDNPNTVPEKTIDDFPKDFVPESWAKPIKLLIHGLVIAVFVYALTVVCDEFYVPALNKISSRLQLQENVAGATFMAIGSSSPELFTSLIGVFIADSDIGTGTIVGSGIFNVLFAIAVCALAAKTALKIDFYPLSRDCLFYALAIVSLLFVLHDGRVYWGEALFLLVLYVGYILVIYYNNTIEKWSKEQMKAGEAPSVEEPASEAPAEETTDETKSIVSNESSDRVFFPFSPPEGVFRKIIWVLLLPVNTVFFLTIPDCRRSFFSYFYFFTFLLSIGWIAVLTYVLVWMTVLIADSFQIPDTVAGLTILAVSSSLPEIISGIIITRQGKGAMAISNSIGSNVFDILVCLGLPWFIKSLTSGFYQVHSAGLVYSTSILLVSIFVLMFFFLLTGFRLNKVLGVILLLCWALAIGFTCVFEYKMYGDVDLLRLQIQSLMAQARRSV